MKTDAQPGQGGFMLLEILLAVAIFAIGVLALGRCLNNCLGTQNILTQEERARVALANAMVEVQANPSLPAEKSSQALKGMFAGITLVETRRTLNLTNEKGVGMTDLNEITLSANWTSPGGAVQKRVVSFDLLRGRG